MAAKKKPNIVILYTDQQRFDSLGCNGNPHAVTPHLDALAAEGTNFSRHIVSIPVCGPSRACFMSGRYPNGNGVWQNGLSLPRKTYMNYNDDSNKRGQRRYGHDIVSHVPTLADAFAEAGYQTRSIGKLHLTPSQVPADYGTEESDELWKQDPSMDDWHGPYYGFQHVELSIGHGEGTLGHYRHWLERNYPEVAKQVDAGTHRKPRFKEYASMYESCIPEEAHHTTWAAEHACSFIRKDPDMEKPFLLYVGFPDPHAPITPPAELAKEFEKHDTLMHHFDEHEFKTKPQGLVHQMMDPEMGTDPWRWPEECIRLMRQYTDAMNHLVDKKVGEIMTELKEQGLWEDTIIIFSSDHGDWLGDHGLLYKETTCSNSINQVPFIIRVPNVVWPKKTGIPMSNADVMPTLCELAGIDIPQGVQGTSVVSEISNGKGEMHPVLSVCYFSNPQYHNFTVYDETYRFTYYPHTGERELYDNIEDPYEMHNLAGQAEYKDTEQRLYQLLLELHMKTDVPAGGRAAIY
jgi:arylsulfatase A-like enzyme